jgi:hypothetical protein
MDAVLNFCYMYIGNQCKFLVQQQNIKTKKKGIQKRERGEDISIEKRTRLTKFLSHKTRESFTMQNHNYFLSKGQDAKGVRPCSKNKGHTCLNS